ncbi:MAG: tyrosine--tRNA ligase [Deltaproteobacteria bacterium]|nr:tyrosine--tRNA ligase [Sandaracinaceae bacterium]MCX7807509.1 tyrosine--tRNA ligase [Deltaproteobacteria bacterium]MDW8245743.1 tyrosine--tRNA ligase [Sandaracinaceae bacterium]
MKIPPAQVQLKTLLRGIVDIVSPEELEARLRESHESGTPLRIKAGFDPTRPDLHLGHTVLLEKMRQFQEFGHEVYFIIGDFTAQIGDPTGRNKTRPPLSRKEIEESAKSYAEQAFLILDRERTKVLWNSDWLAPMRFEEVILLASRYTLARMLERQDFKARFESGSSIALHELLYPLVQAYDSVHIRADVELGGTDQLFNLMVGRDIMRSHGLRPQVVMTTPILEGIHAKADEEGKLRGEKMSKSLGNAIGITEAPEEQFGKLMSISDELMWRYYELLSRKSPEEIQALRSGHPMEAKKALASEIVERFHGKEAARRALANWERQFSRREAPEQIPEFTLQSHGQGMRLSAILLHCAWAESSGQAKALIEQGAVEVNGKRITEKRAELAPGEYLIQVGKRRWGKVRLG